MSFQNVLWGLPKTVYILLYHPEVECPHKANMLPRRAAHKSLHQYKGNKIALDEINLIWNPQIQSLLVSTRINFLTQCLPHRLWKVYSFPTIVITNNHNLGDLTGIYSFRRPGVQNQDVGSTVPPFTAQGRDPSWPLPTSSGCWHCLAISSSELHQGINQMTSADSKAGDTHSVTLFTSGSELPVPSVGVLSFIQQPANSKLIKL